MMAEYKVTATTIINVDEWLDGGTYAFGFMEGEQRTEFRVNADTEEEAMQKVKNRLETKGKSWSKIFCYDRDIGIPVNFIQNDELIDERERRTLEMEDKENELPL